MYANSSACLEELVGFLKETRSMTCPSSGGSRALSQNHATDFHSPVKTFRILDLPAELRVRIWQYAIVSEEPLLLPGPCEHEDQPYALQPPLSHVCHQIRKETLPIFYKENRFEAHIFRADFGYFLNYLTMIGLSKTKMIRKVTLRLQKERCSMTCGAGLLDFVRWCATGEGTHDMGLAICGGTDEDRQAVSSAFAFGLQCYGKRTASEHRLRKAFGAWLREMGLECSCASLEALGRCTSCSCKSALERDLQACGSPLLRDEKACVRA